MFLLMLMLLLLIDQRRDLALPDGSGNRPYL